MNNLLKTIFTLIITGLLIGCSNLVEENRDGGEDVFSRIESLSLSQPETAIVTLDSAERIGLLNPYETNLLRCLIYHNGYSDYRKALRYAVAAYNMPDAPRNAGERLRLIDLIADEYLNNGDYASSIRFCTEGLGVAKDSLINDMEANLHVTLGLNLLEIGNDDEAFRHLRRGVDILGNMKTNDSDKTDDYIYAIGMTVNSLVERGRYDEAADLMDEYMVALEEFEKCPDTVDGIADSRRSSGYAILAYIYSRKGEPDKARKYYDLYCSTDYSSAPEGEQIRIPYLLAAHRFEEALHYIKREKMLWQESADTVSHAYLEEHLKHERDAYEGLGDFRSANRVAHVIETVSDSLRIRDRKSEALELAEIYKTNEQALQIQHQDYSIKIRNIVILFSLILIFLAVLFILRILRQKNVIIKKNRSMSATIEELMGFKDKLFDTQSENIRLRDLLDRREKDFDPVSGDADIDAEATGESLIIPSSDKQESGIPLSMELSDRDRILWERMNHDILGKKLYLERELSKDRLVETYRIPVNKFAKLFRAYTGYSFSQYILNCRLDHAVRLMKEHPNWSLDSIAGESQMSKTTFYSRFQAKYGMSPSEFKSKDNLTDTNGVSR